jgi:hypothetical protein
MRTNVEHGRATVKPSLEPEQARVGAQALSIVCSAPSAAGGRVLFTCVIRYRVEPGKLAELREYARAWIGLVRKYGGTHHGYFVPGTDNDSLPDPTFSFPGLGAAAPADVAFALFSFPSVEAYDRYREAVTDDEACKAATARFDETRCFSGYERAFLVPIFD